MVAGSRLVLVVLVVLLFAVAELGSVLRTYGRMVATMGAPATRFRLLATANGHAVGVYEWSWDTALRAPRPSAEPFLLWPTPRTLRAWSEPEVVKAS